MNGINGFGVSGNYGDNYVTNRQNVNPSNDGINNELSFGDTLKADGYTGPKNKGFKKTTATSGTTEKTVKENVKEAAEKVKKVLKFVWQHIVDFYSNPDNNTKMVDGH